MPLLLHFFLRVYLIRLYTIFYRYEPSQADVTTFQALGKAPASSFPHALRWYNHIKSFGSETSKFPGAKSAAAAPASKPADDDDDDVDLFGSDDEEVLIMIYSWRRILKQFFFSGWGCWEDQGRKN